MVLDFKKSRITLLLLSSYLLEGVKDAHGDFLNGSGGSGFFFGF
jgi:hypothetical protein